MEMTYAALAKSLGITLKSSSSSASTASSAGSLPVSALTPTSSPTLVPKSDSQRSPPETIGAEKNQEKKEAEEGEKDGAPSETPPPLTPADAEEAEAGTKSNAKRKGSAAGDVDSDIASSRSSSPSPTPALESSQEENTTETMESQSTEPTSMSQGMDIDADADENADANSDVPTGMQAVAENDLTDEQLHHAKVLVLDLLGWGVPPEYLLQRGVSHALLYTVFTDLRLRLPDGIVADCVKLVSAQS